MARGILAHGMLPLLVSLAASSALADQPCRIVEVSFTPASRLQIAVWAEDLSGNFIDTLYVTRATGALGLANRPGNGEFKSAYRWPYGRREMVLPVWAHRHNHSYGYVTMGGARGIDKTDNSIGYHESYSSSEPFYCPPSSTKLDAVSCASPFTGSKGLYLPGMSSLYPPRADLTTFADEYDSVDAHHYAADNDIAAISQATPPGGALVDPPITWAMPDSAASGTYRIFVEASREADFNSSHHYPSFPDVNSELRGFGSDALGQPSVVYSVPVMIDGTADEVSTADWDGYGSWDGSDGNLNVPDGTISEPANCDALSQNCGAGRLSLIDGARLKVIAGSCTGCQTAPSPGAMAADPQDTSVKLSFTAPMSNGVLDAASRYEIRYRPGMPLDDDSFGEGIPADTPPSPGTPGTAQSVTLTGLKPETIYYIGVRAISVCGKASPAQFVTTTTQKAKFVTLNGCFIATAAFGSAMVAELSTLRHLRDRHLLSNPMGKMAVAIYYAMSPPLANAISTHEMLRSGARALLSPLVQFSRALEKSPSR